MTRGVHFPASFFLSLKERFSYFNGLCFEVKSCSGQMIVENPNILLEYIGPTYHTIGVKIVFLENIRRK